ncbi:CubicO group peptidase, beta-lactamase class C family [Sinosporangium album]|uniref:CubicO group peptidase, beta-lactamase class C family n=1 Tax=Sinosporangium album TaxID=504805 RepID=A0A1G8JIV5_9ACTN|nr:serine hydrolase domain-containing protein [Sinosporangium album]SDI31219.1 CubicO group peptidase, beta-lactamase class C family [Sinosporangium album]
MMLDDLQKNLEDAARAHGVPGAAIAVWADGALHEAATGVLNVNTGVEATVDSVFQVGSTSKVWTAALVMQLVEEGLVDLDKPVATYLPEFTLADADAAARVTVRHLLTHTGGFEGDIFTDTGRGDDCVDIYVKGLSTAAQVTPPGEALAYCNSGYIVLGALVARLRGAVWEQVVRERLLTPLGCTQAALYPEEALLFRAAFGHVTPPGASEPVPAPHWQLPRSLGPAGSMLNLAPRELVRFARMILAGGVAEDGTRVLAEESVRQMLTPQFKVPDLPGFGGHWGLGFTIMGWGNGAYGHTGGTIGQSTIWWIAPESGVVLAVNANGGDVDSLVEDVVNPITSQAGLVPETRPVPPAEPARADAAPYVGVYAGPQVRYNVAAVDGALEVKITVTGPISALGLPDTAVRFVAYGEHTFIGTEPLGGQHQVISFAMKDGRAARLFDGRALPRV